MKSGPVSVCSVDACCSGDTNPKEFDYFAAYILYMQQWFPISI